ASRSSWVPAAPSFLRRIRQREANPSASARVGRNFLSPFPAMRVSTKKAVFPFFVTLEMIGQLFDFMANAWHHIGTKASITYVEHLPDTEGVTGSNPVSRTIFILGLSDLMTPLFDQGPLWAALFTWLARCGRSL